MDTADHASKGIWLRYASATALVVSALLARLILEPLLGQQAPLILFIAATGVAVWWCGMGPGIFALALGMLLGAWFLLEPRGHILIAHTVDLERLGLLAITGVVIIVLAERSRRALHRAAAEQSAGARNAAILHQVIESSRDCISILDMEGRLLSISSAGQKLFDINDVSAVQNQPWTSLWSDQDQPAVRGALEAAEAGEAGRFRGIRPTADGQPRWWDVLITPIRDQHHEPYGLLAIARDITPLQQAQAELKQAKEAAEAANQSKDQFLAMLSHELRTPLAPVMLSVDALEEDPRFPRQLTDDLATIRRNLNLETKLIDDLLDLSRIAGGKLELHREQVDLKPIIHHVISVCRTSDLVERQLDIQLDTEGDACIVHGDGPRLAQVFWNLLRNAIKFTPDGGRISIAMQCTPEGFARVTVQDTGIGIPPDMVPRVFEAFEQVSRSVTQRYGGLGLGLAISRRIVDLHGGTLTAHSEGPDTGSTFTVELPIAQPAADAPETPALAPHNGHEAEAEASRLRILFVEDHVDTARIMGRLLRDHGHDVMITHTVADALEAADRQRGWFDLVISDVGLPDGSGLDLMRQLKARYSLTGICLSGYGMEQDLQQSRDAGFEAHLVKPVNLSELRSTIGRFVRR